VNVGEQKFKTHIGVVRLRISRLWLLQALL